MIDIKNLTKSYKKHQVLKGIDLFFPRNGLIAICGPSGCGKTTLLNCLSSLLPFDGEIEIDGVKMSKLSEKEKDDYRLKHIGFVFQDFKLFNSETVLRNIMLPLEMANNMKKHLKERKALDLLEIVGLKKYKNHKINQLSGGEKQRIAIARALVNDPKIILADEPTGALDTYNSDEIMKILLKISKKSLVVIVSHDEELMRKYASKIIHMRDGLIDSNEFPNRENRDTYLPVLKNKESNKKPAIPASFLIRHSFMSMKSKKGRTLICNAITSLGLIGVGLAMSLSSTISVNIKKTYASMIDESKIVVSVNENNNKRVDVLSGNYYEAMAIAEKYPNYVMDIGVNYYVDFENFFKSKNEFAIASTTYREVLDGFSTRNINEFKWLDYYTPTKIYPNKVDNLADDEIIIGITYPMVEDICYKLKIVRTVDSLSEYLEKNSLQVYLDVANNDWMYSDQQLFTVKGFVLVTDCCIYHTNHLWNEQIFETNMRFPSTEIINRFDMYPWVMKKIIYFHTYGNTDDFLIEVENDAVSDEYLFEIADELFYPWLYKGVNVKERHRVLFFINPYDSIPKRYSDILLDFNKNIYGPIYGSYGGYLFYPTNMISGFAHEMFFSLSESSLEQVIDDNSSLNLNNNEYITIRDGVMVGHYSKTIQESVRFSPLNGNLIYGREPKTLDEIAISSALLKKLGGSFGSLNYPLFIGYNDQETLMDNGYVNRSFINTQVKITGIVDSPKYEVFHHSYWTINFFKSRLGVSSFDLAINCIAVSSKKTDTKS
ncbi:MAG: ABC transporter ATP-binding protein, partial [Bacilli bacterium]|nr:ABC transporter ATP-binding protein [Bacilli bacterium]